MNPKVLEAVVRGATDGRKALGEGPAPVIVMIHGGGWCVGDKAVQGVTENEAARGKGF